MPVEALHRWQRLFRGRHYYADMDFLADCAVFRACYG